MHAGLAAFAVAAAVSYARSTTLEHPVPQRLPCSMQPDRGVRYCDADFAGEDIHPLPIQFDPAQGGAVFNLQRRD